MTSQWKQIHVEPMFTLGSMLDTEIGFYETANIMFSWDAVMQNS